MQTAITNDSSFLGYGNIFKINQWTLVLKK